MERRGVQLAELGMERRGVLAVLGVSKMREEVGDGHGEVAEVQNTCGLEFQKSHKNMTFKLATLTSSSS